ncbi:MAG: hypothetical protein ACYC9T_16695 [Trichloromonadaceae bacterium]
MVKILKKNNVSTSFAIRRYRKEWVNYLMILAVVSSLLVSVNFIFTDSMVIYVQKNTPDFIQVFFPINGSYSEENSQRSALIENTEQGLSFTLPRKLIDHVRIDPSNEAGDLVIKKIELKHLFGTETFMPDDLLARVKPIQIIDKIELTPNGLLIRSTGNDPAFELKLIRPFILSQMLKIGAVSIFLSLVVFLVAKKLAGEKMRAAREGVYVLAIPLLVSLGVAALFSPGFMSYDTLHALRSARNGVTDSMWPPMVSYVWRTVDLVSLNPSAMHFSQVFLLLFSVFFVVFFFTKKVRYATAFLFIYLSIPVVLGTVAVIWKDVLMAAFFMAGFAAIVAMRFVINRWGFIILSFLAFFLIFLGVCSRHNAITGAVPLFFYLAWLLCSRTLKIHSHIWLGTILFGSLLTGAVYVTKTQLDNYSLPKFEKLNNSTAVFIKSVRVLDVAGASLCVGSNLFAEMAPDLSLAEIKSGYDPRHINLSKGLLNMIGNDDRINKIWLNVAYQHPICFFNNKFQMTKYMVGANEGDQFLITAPSVDNNEYGYYLKKSTYRDSVVDYIVRASHLTFFKPWFLYLISIVSLVYLVRVGRLTADYLTLYLSAAFYLSGLVIFGNAADARLPFYVTTALLIFTFISVAEYIKIKKSEG